jgi:hypothetical protein
MREVDRMTDLYAWLRRLDVSAAAERVVLATVLAIAALASYTHLRAVWVHTGAPWPDLGPLLADGLFAAAWLRMRRRRRQGERVGWLAWLALGIALAATLGGNIAAAVIAGHTDPLALTVAAWPAVAFALVWELVTGHGRPPATVTVPTGDVAGQRVETADERAARLIAEGFGRKRLSKELGVTEHQARDLIAIHRQTNGHEVAP